MNTSEKIYVVHALHPDKGWVIISDAFYPTEEEAHLHAAELLHEWDFPADEILISEYTQHRGYLPFEYLVEAPVENREGGLFQ